MIQGSSPSYLEILVPAGGAILGVFLTLLTRIATVSSREREVASERERIQTLLVSDSVAHAEELPGPSAELKIETKELAPGRLPASAGAQEPPQFTSLLVDYYAHGLVQAKRSSTASLSSSILGGAVILGGVALAVFRSDELMASLIVSLSGVVTNAVGILFHRQASAALTHMETQTKSLRSDMRNDRDSNQAIELIEQVDDGALRDQLRAGVVLQLAKAKLPALGEDFARTTVSNSEGSGVNRTSTENTNSPS